MVSRLVTPDHWQPSTDGTVAVHREGSRDVQVVAGPDGTVEVAVPPERAGRACLTADDLAALTALARRADAVWPGPHDTEFALVAGQVWLLQRRPVTAVRR